MGNVYRPKVSDISEDDVSDLEKALSPKVIIPVKPRMFKQTDMMKNINVMNCTVRVKKLASPRAEPRKLLPKTKTQSGKEIPWYLEGEEKEKEKETETEVEKKMEIEKAKKGKEKKAIEIEKKEKENKVMMEKEKKEKEKKLLEKEKE